MSVFHDEIEIEDFDYDEEEGIYYYPCPCGDRFQVSKEELLAGEEVATCPSCSLIVKVIYDLFVMATSSSDESNMAPKDFQLSSSSDSGSRLSPNRQKCPLCQNFRHTFYCKDCIHSGFFYSSKPKAAADNCFDKQKVLLELQYTRRIAEKDCTKLLEAKRKPDVCLKIRQAKERNRILKLAVEEKKQKKALNNFKLMELREKNEEHKKNLPKYGHKVEEMEIYVAGWKDKNERTREVWKQKEDEIRNLVKLRIQQLFKYIFPIFKVMPPTESESSDDMVSALAEASQTTYIHDRWRYTDYSGEMQYGIVAPTLPHSGNYSAYTIWVAQNQDAVPSSSSTHFVGQNPAYSISAALTYTAQLVHVLSFYLNVRLPYKMNYSDFYSSDMAEQHFVRRVARLNANVLYLCFSQNVDSHWLRSCETIHNLLQLIENERSDLGRQGPIEVDLQQADVLEQPLSNDLRISDASDSEEWEAVPHDCPEVAAGGIAPIQTPQMMSTQQASSMAGGLVNSIASILRGFTGREQLTALGIGSNEVLPGPATQPPPLYPLLDRRAVPINPSLELDYLLILRQDFIDHMQLSGAYLKLPESKSHQPEQEIDKLVAQIPSAKEKYDWSLFPSELRPKMVAKRIKKAVKEVNVEQRLTLLEKLEEKSDDAEATTNNEEAEDEEAEVVEMEDEDEEMDDGTDYANNYFDNGEAYEDEDDNLEDGPIY